MLDDVLKKKSTRLSYADSVLMPDNYLVKYDSNSADEIAKKRKNAEAKVAEAVKSIRSRTIKPVERKYKLLSRAVNKVIYTNIEGFDKKFKATNACIGCGLCSEICPVQNIKLEDHRPVWRHQCERCLACIQWCPTEAIQYGKKTAQRVKVS
jgi:ferredoxin